MKTNMGILNAKVTHNAFGTGLVSAFEGGVITICFFDHGEKKFIYPDAFDKFLKMCDPALEAIVSADLSSKTAEIEAEKARLEQKCAEEAKHLAVQKAQKAAPKKKAAPKARTPKAAKTEDEESEEDEE